MNKSLNTLLEGGCIKAAYNRDIPHFRKKTVRSIVLPKLLDILQGCSNNEIMGHQAGFGYRLY